MTQRRPPDAWPEPHQASTRVRDASAAAATARVERVALFLHPAQIFAGAEPTAITTILGSCVAVCLYDPARRIGGMNHFLLPHPVAGPRFPARFGRVAIARLVERMADFGCAATDLEAKVFGGARVVRALATAEGGLGADNVQLAIESLHDFRIPIRARDVGGMRGRKLVFHTDDGAAWVRAI